MSKLQLKIPKELKKIKNDIYGYRECDLLGESFRIYLYSWNGPNIADPLSTYDEDGKIFVSRWIDPAFAEILGVHERIEIDLRLKGFDYHKAHAYAKMKELLLAKETGRLEEYIWHNYEESEYVVAILEIINGSSSKKQIVRKLFDNGF